MGRPCADSDTKRHIEIITWSGTRSSVVCDLNASGTVNHWVRIKNWKLKPVTVDLEASIFDDPNRSAEFHSAGVPNVTAVWWEEKSIRVPEKTGSIRVKPGEVKLPIQNSVALRAIGQGVSEAVFVNAKVSFYPDQMEPFSLGIRMDT